MSDPSDEKRRAGADPLRHRILQALLAGDARTEAELARALGEPIDTIHFHSRVLEDAGVITGDGDGDARAFTPGELTMSWSWSQPVDMAGHVNAKFEAARRRCIDALYRNARQMEAGGESGPFSVATPWFTTSAAEIASFHAELLALVERYEQRAAEQPDATRRLRFMYALHDEPA